MHGPGGAAGPPRRAKEIHMKRVLYAVATLTLLAAPVLVLGEDAAALKTDREKQSYAIGVEMANNMKRQGVDVDGNLVAQGIRDVLSGGKTLLTEAEVKDAVMTFQKDLMAKRQAEQKVAGDKAKVASDAFMAANAKKDGVKTLPSGLQYKVIKDGTGAIPKATDSVTLNYRGRLVDGTEFDSSYSHNEPITHPVNGFIAGWTEALQLMKVGSKWELYIPASLAYGERGAGGKIPPNSALVFEVELLGIK
jgi:FKBP-type peptidyl-prolyl cis-trans isomerase FklB